MQENMAVSSEKPAEAGENKSEKTNNPNNDTACEEVYSDTLKAGGENRLFKRLPERFVRNYPILPKNQLFC